MKKKQKSITTTHSEAVIPRAIAPTVGFWRTGTADPTAKGDRSCTDDDGGGRGQEGALIFVVWQI